jgi:hypothetical protein
MPASGFRLLRFTKFSPATSTAAAPSVMPDELPAVIVPAFENTGANRLNAAGLARVAEDGFVDLFRLDSGALHRCLCRYHSHVCSGQ